MPKKKILQRAPRYSSADEKILEPVVDEETIQTGEDGGEPQDSVHHVREEEIIRKLFLKPAGFPIKPVDAPEKLQITISDPNLFQAYASEQWLGISVRINDYIFDQLIIPDFAFKIIKVMPKNAHRIGAETRFSVIQQSIQKPKFKPITFNEIIGNNQAKLKAKIIVHYLQNPEKFGEWAPRNILFHGEPGTGKTLMAKAIATSSNCTFIARKGTALIGLHVGDGASKIHELFALAKKHAPAIIFIDELDSIGLNRSYQNVRGDVVEVATALLAEMDGLETNEGVITIGATNGASLLDPGLRSRFEEEIEFPIPTEQERKAMLELFSKKVPVPLRVNYEKLAKATEKWSGRDLHEKLVKVAIHQAIQDDLNEITTEMLLKIITQVTKQNAGGKPPSGIFT